MWSKNRTTRWAAWLTLIIFFCSSVSVAFGGRARTARGVTHSQYKRSVKILKKHPKEMKALRQSLRPLNVRTATRSKIAVEIRPMRQELRGFPSGLRRSALNVISFELDETIKERPLNDLGLTNFDKVFLEMRNTEGEAYTKEVQEKAKREIRYEGLLFDNHIEILKIKNQLDQLKYFKNDGTARWDKSLTDAVKSFQSDHPELKVDGIPGQKTQEKLDEEIRKIILGVLHWGGEPILGDMPTRDNHAAVLLT